MKQFKDSIVPLLGDGLVIKDNLLYYSLQTADEAINAAKTFIINKFGECNFEKFAFIEVGLFIDEDLDTIVNLINTFCEMQYFVFCFNRQQKLTKKHCNTKNFMFVEGLPEEVLYSFMCISSFCVFYNKMFDRRICLASASLCKHVFIEGDLVVKYIESKGLLKRLSQKNIFQKPQISKLLDIIAFIDTYEGFIDPASVYVEKGFVFHTDNNELYRFIGKENTVVLEPVSCYTPKIYKMDPYFCDFIHCYNIYALEKLNYFTYFIEWSFLQRKDVVKMIFEFGMFIMNKGYMLSDPHYFNASFLNSIPVYIDFDSIHKYSDNGSLICFIKYMQKNIMDTLNNAVNFDETIPKINELVETINKSSKFEELCVVNDKIMALVDQLYVEKDNCTWSFYCSKIPQTLDEFRADAANNKRTKLLLEALLKYKPTKVIDFGSNSGYYSFMAEALGSDVLATDNINDVVEAGYSLAKSQNKNITYVLLDLLNLQEIPGTISVYSRFCSEFGIASAISHHLFKKGMSFEQQSELFGRLCLKYLFVEFIPREDVHVSQWNVSADYNLENYIKALSKHFDILYIEDSVPLPRKCIMCARKQETK